eukprot:TRINITY_DN4782_c0_g1_i2.p2 TRINITY_DN4782_c0_g1~~TRINITY_DN4782_c0_g1_i2.p2  ORF type:complete len:131 (-),score=30.72 TRINITY_DN4782_c0_g1_i2:28-420(-)
MCFGGGTVYVFLMSIVEWRVLGGVRLPRRRVLLRLLLGVNSLVCLVPFVLLQALFRKSDRKDYPLRDWAAVAELAMAGSFFLFFGSILPEARKTRYQLEVSLVPNEANWDDNDVTRSSLLENLETSLVDD